LARSTIRKNIVSIKEALELIYIKHMNYLLLKLIHVAAVIIFLGNIITGHFWMHLAIKSKDINIIRHSVLGVMRSDKIFTIPAVIIIIVAGILAALYGNISVLRTGWIVWYITLFSLSGVIFSTKLSVVLGKILKLINDQQGNGELEWISINSLYKQWNSWALVAIMLPLAALVMMVLKIPG
jgi:uncharacterized membrane protein